MTPLAGKLAALIRAGGPMTVADYMAHCLGDPLHGYYTTRDPLGAAGDFTTAPEVSQMFGEIVGAWLVHAWREAGASDGVRLVELGPGRGTLMADILRVADRAGLTPRLAAIHLVETSPVLRERQCATLAGRDILWQERFSDVPAGPLLLVANEFFDALPIRQFVRTDGVWRERVVGLDGDSLVFGLGPPVPLEARADDAAVLERCPSATMLAGEIGSRVAAGGVAALVIDYGYDAGSGDTLQAVSRHAYADPLAAPGEADLTAHVDFSALAQAARAAGAAVHGPVPQGAFLRALGLEARAEQLAAGRDEAARAALEAAVHRLAAQDAMGALFKALALTPPGVTPPPFAYAV